MGDSTPRPPLNRALVYLASLAVPTVFAFYLGIFLKGDLDLKYYREGVISAHRGPVMVDPENGEVELVVTQVSFNGQAVEDIDLVRFTLANADWQSLSRGAEFFFFSKGNPIPDDCILGVKPQMKTSTNDLVKFETTSDKDRGTGLRLESDLPANSRIGISLVVKRSCEVSDAQILKVYRGRERLAIARHPSQTMITLPLRNAIVWCVVVACLYSISWMLTNIYLCNFSTGARIFDLLLRKLTGWSIIEWARCRREGDTPDVSTEPSDPSS